MHAWYSAEHHRNDIKFYWSHTIDVIIVTIDGVDKVATCVGSKLSGGDRYLWPDKVYLGEFKPSTQRLVPPDSVPVR